MNADETAINDRFLIGMGLMLDANTDNPTPPFQLLTDNQPEEPVDGSTVWGAWRIEPGDQALAQTDGTMLMLGNATLMLVAPKGSLEAAEEARALRDQFFALFKNWRSPDKCLWISKMGTVPVTSKDDYRLAARIYWQSYRS